MSLRRERIFRVPRLEISRLSKVRGLRDFDMSKALEIGQNTHTHIYIYAIAANGTLGKERDYARTFRLAKKLTVSQNFSTLSC